MICGFRIKIWCLSLDLCVVAKLAVHAFVCCDKWFADIISWPGLKCRPLLQSNSFGFCVWMSFRSIVKSDWVLAACCLLTLHSLKCRLLTPKSHSVPSELCICSCVLSAAAADYNTTIPEGLYLRSTWEHCHPLWGQRKTSSKVRPSFCCTFMRKLIRLCSVPTLKAGDCTRVNIMHILEFHILKLHFLAIIF